MKSREIASVYFAGIIQGLALVSFPAASTIFTSPQAFDLSSTSYGSLFIPQVVLAIMSSLWVTKLGTIKHVYLAGLLANFASMTLLFLSSSAIGHQTTAYLILLLATACLGVGFGLTVPCINTFAALFFPQSVDGAILILNALLGLGTALAPLLIALFTGFGIWWGLPLLLMALFALTFLFTLPLPLQDDDQRKEHLQSVEVPKGFWIFAIFAILYGIVETVNGNWATIYMTQDIGAPAATASFALAAFWTMVTLGRVFFGAMEHILSPHLTYRILPFVTAAAFIFASMVPAQHPYLGIMAFGLAGIGCSALLPLSISFGTESFPSAKAATAGRLIACYLFGYGIAAFGVGYLHDQAGLHLKTIFMSATLASIILGILSLINPHTGHASKIDISTSPKPRG